MGTLFTHGGGAISHGSGEMEAENIYLAKAILTEAEQGKIDCQFLYVYPKTSRNHLASC